MNKYDEKFWRGYMEFHMKHGRKYRSRMYVGLSKFHYGALSRVQSAKWGD